MKLCHPDPTGSKYMTLVYAMSVACLRLISLGTDLIDKGTQPDSFYRPLCYILYFPTFLTGPFLTYRQFIEQVNVIPVLYVTALLAEWVLYLIEVIFVKVSCFAPLYYCPGMCWSLRCVFLQYCSYMSL